jgi:hypothetical protein
MKESTRQNNFRIGAKKSWWKVYKMFGQMKIKTRILGILAVLAMGYLALLAMVQLSANATHSRMSQISTSLFPAALKMQEA